MMQDDSSTASLLFGFWATVQKHSMAYKEACQDGSSTASPLSGLLATVSSPTASSVSLRSTPAPSLTAVDAGYVAELKTISEVRTVLATSLGPLARPANYTVKTRYLVSAPWAKELRDFCSGGPCPGPVDTTSFLEAGELPAGLVFGRDFEGFSITQFFMCKHLLGTTGPPVRCLCSRTCSVGMKEKLPEPSFTCCQNGSGCHVENCRQCLANQFMKLIKTYITGGKHLPWSSVIGTAMRKELEEELFSESLLFGFTRSSFLGMLQQQPIPTKETLASVPEPTKSILLSRMHDLKFVLQQADAERPRTWDTCVAAVAGATQAEANLRFVQSLKRSHEAMEELSRSIPRNVQTRLPSAPESFPGLMEVEDFEI